MLTVGEILKNERKKKGLSFKVIEKEIKIREKFLKAIEENNWKIFSSKVYLIGIIKNYSRFLGLPPQKVLAYFYRDYEKKEKIGFKEKISDKYFSSETKLFLKNGLIALIIFFSIYFIYQLKLYLSPPSFQLISPKTNFFRLEDKIKIIGKTDKEASIVIFGKRVYQNQDGVFEYDFPLKEGKNRLIIEITGVNGKVLKVEKEFIKKTF